MKDSMAQIYRDTLSLIADTPTEDQLIHIFGEATHRMQEIGRNVHFTGKKINNKLVVKIKIGKFQISTYGLCSFGSRCELITFIRAAREAANRADILSLARNAENFEKKMAEFYLEVAAETPIWA